MPLLFWLGQAYELLTTGPAEIIDHHEFTREALGAPPHTMPMPMTAMLKLVMVVMMVMTTMVVLMVASAPNECLFLSPFTSASAR